jgi:8-oxo-dGTP pyrophosphatase MutT (NUDIX family)
LSEAVLRLAARLTSAGTADAPESVSQLPRAAVLVLIDRLAGVESVILTRRADHLRLHAGEVAFPGGKCDEEDVDAWHTALREAEEEIALPVEHVERLGVLPSLVTRTGIEVVPCVAELSRTSDLKPNPDELAAVFSVPLAFFAEAANLSFIEFDYGGRRRQVPRYQWQDYTIWGITAAILVQLVNLGCDAGLEMEAYWRGVQHPWNGITDPA